MSGTNVPALTFSSAGIVVPAEADIQAGLWADFQAAFGGALNPSPASPQGQLIASITAIIGASNDLLLALFNGVDPAFADGRMQDAIARIYYLARNGPIPTMVQCTCSGASGTVIPAGSLASATDGTIYQSLASGTISSGGSVTIAFASITTGPIACPAASLSSIYRIVSGWDTITNPSDGVIGTDTETRAQFEARRAASVADNATGILPAVRGAVLALSGVTDAYVYENPTGSAATFGGISVAANSLYVAAWGGANADVAQAIWQKKPPGAAYTGNTTVTITDSSNGYEYPYPSYSVTFERPTALPIFIAVTLANNGQVPANALALTQAAIQAAFLGEDGGSRATIGATIYALRFAGAVASLGSWAQIIAIAIGTAASPTGADQTVNINQMPTISAGSITLTLA